jgi:membrane protein YdbS with pleckstrin-like domain
MNKLLPILQLCVAALCLVIAVATLVNLIYISQRPETISVVNAIIGQGVLIIGFSAFAKILFSKGLKGLRELGKGNEAS